MLEILGKGLNGVESRVLELTRAKRIEGASKYFQT